MSLSDVMRHSGLAAFTEVGLIVSLVAFLAIVAWVMIRPGRDMEAEGRRPLDPEDERRQKSEDRGRTSDV